MEQPGSTALVMYAHPIPERRKLSMAATHRRDEHSAGFSQRALAVVGRIPYGKVLAYGDVAALVGSPRAARGVGFALRNLPQGSDVPWWRVINARGEISLAGLPGNLQRMLLQQEGIVFGRGGRVDLQRHRWSMREDRL